MLNLGNEPTSLSRLVRFGAAGLTATLFYLVLANVLVWGGRLSPLTSSMVAYLISIVFSYLLQSRFTFGVQKDSVKQIARFAVTSLAGLFVCWGVTYVTFDIMCWSFFPGSMLICILLPAINYFLFQVWVFSTGPHQLQQNQKHEE
jgi:putative flippase GtrA